MKRLILVLAVFVLVAGPVIAGIWTLIVPKYEARGEIRVRAVIPHLVFKTDENGVVPFYDAYVNTQVSILRSPTVLQRVLDQREVQQTQWFKSPAKTLRQRLGGDALPPVERLKEGLCVQPRPQTELVDVSFTDTRAEDAKTIVHSVLDEYLRYVLTAADEDEQQLDHRLAEVCGGLAREIEMQERDRAVHYARLQTDNPQELISRKRIRLDETQTRLQELRRRISMLEWEMKQPGGTTDGNSPDAPSRSRPKYYEDTEWRKLDLDVRMAQHQIDKSNLTSNAPDRAGLTKDLAFAKDLLQLREQQLNAQWNDHMKDVTGREDGVIPVEHQLARVTMEEQLLEKDLTTQQAEFAKLFETAQSLEKVDADLQHKRELFHAVQSRLDQREIERHLPSAIEILAPADCPPKPARDHRVVFTAGAALLGLCAAGGTAFLTRRPKTTAS
jgi:uncharacterized protein involved in exopolysaccharide biosynthesis